MSNIRCIFLGEPKRACVATRVSIPNHPPTSILFSIDLNTTRSFVSPKDLRNMGIDLSSLPSLSSNVKVFSFGRRVPNKRLALIDEICSTKFVTNTGLYEVPFEGFIAIKSEEIGYARLPSVLGVDFLNDLRLKLYINVHGDQIELKYGDS